MNARAMQRLNVGLPNPNIVVTASLALIGQNVHLRAVVLKNAAGLTLTLPPAKGSGIQFTVLIQTPVSAASYIIKKAIAGDIIQGIIYEDVLVTPASTPFAAGATDNTITLNASTTGGLGIGDWFDFIDMASGIWAVSGNTAATGAVATPFSTV